jgi:hypothetical protein
MAPVILMGKPSLVLLKGTYSLSLSSSVQLPGQDDSCGEFCFFFFFKKKKSKNFFAGILNKVLELTHHKPGKLLLGKELVIFFIVLVGG